MNEPGARVIDWPAVLARAHRRVAMRLALAAGVGAVGAVLLLGGGSATRASIQDNATPPPSDGPTGPGGAGSKQPNLVIAAEAIEPAEGEAFAGEGRFTVTNESSTDAEEFEVVATAQSIEPQIFFAENLPAGDSTGDSFACPPGDTVVVKIESEQPREDPETVECPSVPRGPTGATGGPTGATGSTGTSGATGPTEPPEPPEPPEEPKSLELE